MCYRLQIDSNGVRHNADAGGEKYTPKTADASNVVAESVSDQSEDLARLREDIERLKSESAAVTKATPVDVMTDEQIKEKLFQGGCHETIYKSGITEVPDTAKTESRERRSVLDA